MTPLKPGKTLFLMFSIVLLLVGSKPADGQTVPQFPLDPYSILKTWNYDRLVSAMGDGEEIIGTMKNQKFLAGLKYPFDLLGMKGSLEFTFTKDSISIIQFRKEHTERVIGADLRDRMAMDTLVSKAYNIEIQQLDSLRRDSVVREISSILGPPLSSGPTSVTEKNARHSAVWINKGYSCLYKDYLSYTEIVFALPNVPLWTVGEFEIPSRTEIIQKSSAGNRKMSWNASLLGTPSRESRAHYSDIFLLLEYTAGQRYLATIPQDSISFLPSLTFEDCNGNAIPDAWVQVPADAGRNQIRHFIFSLRFKEPNLMFNSDEQIPSVIELHKGNELSVIFPYGTTRTVKSPTALNSSDEPVEILPKGFKFLNTTKFNSDGSTNFIGGIEIYTSPGKPSQGTIEILYKHIPGGWEPDQVTFLPAKN